MLFAKAETNVFVNALHPTVKRLASAQAARSGLCHELEREFLTRLLCLIPQRTVVKPQMSLQIRRLHIAKHTAPHHEAAGFHRVKQQPNVETIESWQRSIKKNMVLTECMLYMQQLLLLSQKKIRSRSHRTSELPNGAQRQEAPHCPTKPNEGHPKVQLGGQDLHGGKQQSP